MACFLPLPPFPTDAGPLFLTVMTRDQQAGYLHRPEGPPPPETWTLTGEQCQPPVRRCLRFRQIYVLPSDWYAVVWEWGEKQPADTATPADAPTTAKETERGR